MATLNLTLDTRRARKDGTYPLVFRLRVEDKFSDIGTDFKIFKEQFDLEKPLMLTTQKRIKVTPQTEYIDHLTKQI